MKIVRSGLALVAVIGLCAPAAAFSVTNNDEVSYRIAVQVGDQKAEHAVEPGATVETACGEACVVMLFGAEGKLDEMEAIDADQLIVTTGAFQRAE